jgi:hypothetical protein
MRHSNCLAISAFVSASKSGGMPFSVTVAVEAAWVVCMPVLQGVGLIMLD